jgi:hypothetical protein
MCFPPSSTVRRTWSSPPTTAKEAGSKCCPPLFHRIRLRYTRFSRGSTGSVPGQEPPPGAARPCSCPGPGGKPVLGIPLHIAGLEAVDQRPVGGGGKKHLGAVEVPLEAVQRGARRRPPGHGHRRAHLVPEGAAAVVVSSEEHPVQKRLHGAGHVAVVGGGPQQDSVRRPNLLNGGVDAVFRQHAPAILVSGALVAGCAAADGQMAT